MKSQGAELSFSSVSVRRRTSAPFRRSPLFLAAGRLTRPFGRKPPADGETPEKPRSRAQLFRRFCALGMRRGFRLAGFRLGHRKRGWASCLPGKTGAVRGPALGTNRVRARLGKATNPVRDLPAAGARACETRGRKKTGCATCPPQVRVLLGAAAPQVEVK